MSLVNLMVLCLIKSETAKIKTSNKVSGLYKRHFYFIGWFICLISSLLAIFFKPLQNTFIFNLVYDF